MPSLSLASHRKKGTIGFQDVVYFPNLRLLTYIWAMYWHPGPPKKNLLFTQDKQHLFKKKQHLRVEFQNFEAPKK